MGGGTSSPLSFRQRRHLHLLSLLDFLHTPPESPRNRFNEIFGIDDDHGGESPHSGSQDPDFIFPPLGIKVSFFQEFISTYPGGSDAFIGMTTQEVCDKVIKPLTISHKTSLCQMLYQYSHPSISNIDHIKAYISHSWHSPFLDMVHAIERMYSNAMDTVIWIDIFSINQHLTPMIQLSERRLSWWITTLQDGIKQIGNTVLVISPWQYHSLHTTDDSESMKSHHDDDANNRNSNNNNEPQLPHVLTRTWCLWEIFCTWNSKSRLEIAFTNNDEKNFIQYGSTDGIHNMLYSQLDIYHNSECSIIGEKEKILQAVNTETAGTAMLSLIQLYADVETGMNGDGIGGIGSGSGGGWGVSGSYTGGSHSSNSMSVSGNNSSKKDSSERGPYHSFHTVINRRIEVTLSDMLYHALLSDYQTLIKKAEESGKDDTNYSLTLAIYEVAHELYIRMNGEHHEYTLLSLRNLGAFHCQNGFPKKACTVFEHCLEMQKKSLGDDHLDTLETMRLLALAYYDLRDSYTEPDDEEKVGIEGSTAKIEDTKEDCKQGDHGDLAVSVSSSKSECKVSEEEKEEMKDDTNHKSDAQKAIDWEYEMRMKAMTLLEQYMTKWRSIYDCEDLTADFVVTMNNLAVMYSSFEDFIKRNDYKVPRSSSDTDIVQDRNEMAIALYNECLVGCRETFGDDHFETINTIGNLGWSYCTMGKYQEALPLLEEALMKKRKARGEHHRDTMEAMLNLAGWYFRQLDELKDEEENEKTKREEARKHNDCESKIEHALTLNAGQFKGQITSKFAEYVKKALPLHQEGLILMKEILGETNHRTLIHQTRLARVYEYNGMSCEAEQSYRDALEKLIENEGEDHYDVIIVKNNLAVLHEDQGNDSRAISLYLECYEKMEKNFGANDDLTLSAIESLGDLYLKMGQYKDALCMYEKLFERKKEVFGENHRETLQTMYDQAQAYKHLNEHDTALRLHEDCLQKRRAVLGDDDRHTKKSILTYEECLCGQLTKK